MMNIDFSEFNEKFFKVTRKIIPASAENGVGAACLQVLNDAVFEVPTVPLKEGWLRGSGSAFVNGNYVGSTEGVGGAKAGKANTTPFPMMHAGAVIGHVGFNTPYASRLHEGVGFSFTEPSSGAKFLSSKLQKNRKRYAEIIANRIKGG